MVDISKDDFGTLCICAVRYCMGRRTYMPSLVQGIVREHFKDLDTRDLDILEQERGYQQRFNLWGDICDRESWLKFWKDFEKYRKEAGR